MTAWVFRRPGIRWVTNAVIDRVTAQAGHRAAGQALPFRSATIIPPFRGVAAVRRSPGLADTRGVVPVTETSQHPRDANVYAAGVAVAVRPPVATPVSTGVLGSGRVWLP